MTHERTAGRATVVSALKFPIAERLVREAAIRNLTLGETIELALIEGWFMKPTPAHDALPHCPQSRS